MARHHQKTAAERRRERRAANAPRRARATRLLTAQVEYLTNVGGAEFSEVVCDECGLAQKYVHDTGCRRSELLDLPCNGKTCVTIDAWQEAA